MKNKNLGRTIILSIVFIILFSCSNNHNIPPYKNPDLSIDERTEDLLSRMTIEEKFWQCFMIPGDLSDGKEKYKHGIFGFQVATKGKTESEGEQLLDYSEGGTAKETAILINNIQRYFIEETRLGIPIIAFDEALHGLVRKGATAFPQSIALAATWDTTLMGNVAKAIALEVKTRGIRQILSPVLNIARDVRWGRTEETYGEDPFLTTQMGVAFISQFEKFGVITTPKHFIANVGDGGRDSYPIHFDERILEEVYFPAFKTCFQKAGAWSVMTSYNSLDGRQCSANNWLLNEKLKKDWGFNGFVISDANAVGGANVLHYTSKDYAESGKQAIENGLDVIFQTSYDHKTLFYPAFEKGEVDEEKLDEAVRRVLRAKFKLGLFENPYVDVKEATKWNVNEKHRLIAKKAAQESIVLLKNARLPGQEDKTLPISKDIKSIAIIGTDAVEARLGGYSGPGNHPVSILDGIRNKIGKSCNIKYASGCGREIVEFETISAEHLSCIFEGEKKKGLKGEYFNNISLEGEPALTRIDPQIKFRWTLYSPDKEKINYDWYSTRWTGQLTAHETGKFKIGINGNDGYRLYLNDELIIDNWQKQTFRTITKDYWFNKGEEYDLKIEFYESVGNVRISLVWNMGLNNSYKQKIQEAVELANAREMTIIVVGIEEGEAMDRASLNLPGRQEEMIKTITATGKPVVVVLVGGSAIIINEWIDDVPAILDIWYPGEEGGNAVADVLFGDYNPAGRLPITFPIHEGQLPLYYNHKPTGRNDDYMNLTGKPLFPFGYGLSYSNFKYSDLKFSSTVIATTDTLEAKFKISNIGEYAGDEVVQLYIRDLFASVARPVMELKGFKRVHLGIGETKEIIFKIAPELLTMLDKNLNKIVEPGEFRIMIGASSNDIRLQKILELKE